MKDGHSMQVVDLFAGGGGMSLGFQQAGFKIACAMEKWQPAIDMYKANFVHPIFNVDLSNEEEAIKKIQEYPFDIIIGGPPCQDFSSAGKRDEQQGRASLTIHFANIVAACQPGYFVMENVPRTATSEAFKKALAIFKDAEYGLTAKVIDAAYCGVPQYRKRFFLIGKLKGSDDFIGDALDRRKSKHPLSLREYFGDQLDFNYYYRHPRSYARRGIFSIDEPSPTIRGVNRPVPKGYPGHAGDPVSQSENIRCLTTLQRAQIQTFPTNFRLLGSKTDLEQVIGNAVPVKLAQFVASCLAEYICGLGQSHPHQLSIFQKKSRYEVLHHTNLPA